jgi:hypothetical protein
VTCLKAGHRAKDLTLSAAPGRLRRCWDRSLQPQNHRDAAKLRTTAGALSILIQIKPT